MASRSTSRRRSSRSQPVAKLGISFDELAIAGFVLLAVLLGGASAGGFLGNAVLQMVAALLITWGIVSLDWTGDRKAERVPLMFALALVGYMLVQLVPLPPAIWTLLPGRAGVVEGFVSLGIAPLPWMPISLVPSRTLAGIVSMLPPIAALVMVLRCGRNTMPIVLWSLFAVAIASVLIGLGQLSGGSGSPLYFYENTNFGLAVGFFANSNHLATLMLIVLPLVAGAGANARIGGDETGAATIAWIAVPAVALLALLGLLVAGSLAGYLLAPIALAAGYVIFGKAYSRRVRRWMIPGTLAVVALAVAIVVFSPSSLDLGSTNLGTEGMSRGHIWPITLSAMPEMLPFGSGYGSFDAVFRQFEDPATIGPVHANHAHSDLFETVLEGGVVSAVLLLLFLSWYVRRTWTLWMKTSPRDPINCAASVSVGLVLLHSLVDYPLRTAAIAVPFALCCGLMARAPRSATANIAAEAPSGKHLSV